MPASPGNARMPTPTDTTLTICCPHCVAGIEFKPMTAYKDGRFVCGDCAHTFLRRPRRQQQLTPFLASQLTPKSLLSAEPCSKSSLSGRHAELSLTKLMIWTTLPFINARSHILANKSQFWSIKEASTLLRLTKDWLPQQAQ